MTATPTKTLRDFCRVNGIHINMSGGIPLMSKGQWVDCFDNTQAALDFIRTELANWNNGGRAPKWV